MFMVLETSITKTTEVDLTKLLIKTCKQMWETIFPS